MNETTIAEARADVVDAQLRLAAELRACCPGSHRFVEHGDDQPPWCPDCGYSQSGVRVGGGEVRD